MNDLRERYFNMQCSFFPMVEEEIGELTAKMKEFLRIVELVQPERFINVALQWCGLGRPMANREKMLRVFFMKAVYDLPTTNLTKRNCLMLFMMQSCRKTTERKWSDMRA